MKPKLDDVAKLANVSKTTVSRVLNKRGYLSQETIDKVYDAMAKLNYQPNTVARQLYNKKTQIIGLIFPTVTNPFFGELVEELEKKLYLQGYKVIIGNSMNDPEKETNYLNQLLSNQVDGLIVGTHNQDIEQYKNDNLPIVAIDQIMNEDIPIIESDNYLGGQLATERLINKGAKKSSTQLVQIISIHQPIDVESPMKIR
ncbi:LacI family transcriptional regulator [Mammaliicoccus sciuri]|nr:LacI family transcriptional regulator [Mammaliicoccus sciuri]